MAKLPTKQSFPPPSAETMRAIEDAETVSEEPNAGFDRYPGQPKAPVFPRRD
jgi:hypothetical protein